MQNDHRYKKNKKVKLCCIQYIVGIYQYFTWPLRDYPVLVGLDTQPGTQIYEMHDTLNFLLQ